MTARPSSGWAAVDNNHIFVNTISSSRIITIRRFLEQERGTPLRSDLSRREIEASWNKVKRDAEIMLVDIVARTPKPGEAK